MKTDNRYQFMTMLNNSIYAFFFLLLLLIYYIFHIKAEEEINEHNAWFSFPAKEEEKAEIGSIHMIEWKKSLGLYLKKSASDWLMLRSWKKICWSNGLCPDILIDEYVYLPR